MSRVTRCLLALALAGLAPAAARAEDEPAPALAETKVETLIEAWRGAPAKTRTTLEAELRRRGPAVVPALERARAGAAATERDAIERMIRTVTRDWHRRHVPKGMVYIPAGPVEVPRTEAPWGPSGRRVRVEAFYMDQLEVSVGAWREWLARLAAEEEPGRKTVRTRPPPDRPARWPMTGMTWDEAREFARASGGGRLPRAEEFERALRGAGVSTYPWGSASLAGRANLRGYGDDEPMPVGSFARGISAFGVLDLVGNVAEWSATTRKGGSAARSVIPLVLGGSFRHAPDPALTWRGRDRLAPRGPRDRRDWVGFRVVRDVPPLPASEEETGG